MMVAERNEMHQTERSGRSGATQGRADAAEAEITIRDMALEDIAPVFHLGEQLFTPDRWPTLYRTWDQSEVASLWASSTGTCLVADRNDEIAGFALGSIIDKPHGAWTYGYLLWLGVDPATSRRGIGGRLIRELTRRFRARGAKMVLVDTEAENKAAISLFRRVGFGEERPHVYFALRLSDQSEPEVEVPGELSSDEEAHRS